MLPKLPQDYMNDDRYLINWIKPSEKVYFETKLFDNGFFSKIVRDFDLDSAKEDLEKV